MNSSNQHHHSNVLRSWILTWSRSSRLEHCVPMRFYVGTVFPNLIRIFVVAMLTCVLTPVPGFVHATTQKCPRVHVLAGLPNCSFFRLLRDTREHMLVDEQTLPSISDPSEAGRGGGGGGSLRTIPGGVLTRMNRHNHEHLPVFTLCRHWRFQLQSGRSSIVKRIACTSLWL